MSCGVMEATSFIIKVYGHGHHQKSSTMADTSRDKLVIYISSINLEMFNFPIAMKVSELLIYLIV